MPSSVVEFQIIQNELIGAQSIWEFAKYYAEYSKGSNSPEFILAFPVLPIVLNKRAAREINSRNFKESSLFRTINENRDIYSGLQSRMEALAPLTLKSLNVAFNSNLLSFDPETTRLVAKQRTFDFKQVSPEYVNIIYSARRIGAWFGQLDIKEIRSYFNISF